MLRAPLPGRRGKDQGHDRGGPRPFHGARAVPVGGLTATFSVVSADMGLISPDNVSVYEPGQKAIIGWNGEQEVLILSTDVRASENTRALELIPMPSRPDPPEAGSFGSFTQIQSIINDRVWFKYAEFGRSMPAGGGVEILFENKIGAHDITVVKASNASQLIDLAEALLEDKGLMQEVSWIELENLAVSYLGMGLNYWVLDLIDLSNHLKSREPLIYAFESDCLYFPLEISSLAFGESKISLFILTENSLDENSIQSTGLRIKYFTTAGKKIPMEFELSESELNQVSSKIAGLFENNAQLTVLEYDGPLENLEGNLIIDHLKAEGLRQGGDLIEFSWIIVIVLVLGGFAVAYSIVRLLR